MKFGEQLRAKMVKEWEDKYIDYDRLKHLISELEQLHITYDTSQNPVSLAKPVPLNAAAQPRSKSEVTHEEFFALLESNMRKIENFTKEQVC